MFHCARALIYSAGYREKSHYYLLVALRALFVGPKMLDEKLIVEFHEAMALREGADYHSEFSKEGAESVIESAREMLKKSKNILHKDI
ncbi:MAG: HEPN domain-containing protein [Endomicrobiales bacterium]|nr:HEPN domain-containing protein [Endomicrobiales bacterium]